MTRRLTIDDLYALRLPEQPVISPDGSQVVYVLHTADRDGDRETRALWILPVTGGATRQLTRGSADSDPAWSPDSSQIAFLRAADGPPQLCTLPLNGGEVKQITSLPLGAGAPRWSPDGTRVAFTAPVDLAVGDGDDDSTRSRRASDPVVTDRLDYKADGVGLLRTVRKHLHVLDMTSDEIRQVTSGKWHAGDPAWSPDGMALAFAAALDPDADLTFRVGVYVVASAERNAQPRLVGLREGVAGPVTWTADGAALLVVGCADTKVGHADLLCVPLGGGDVVNLAASLDRNVMPGEPAYPGALPQFTEDGREVLFCVRDHGCTHVYAVNIEGGTLRCLVGDGNVSGMSVAGGVAAVVLGTPTSYGEIATVDVAYGTVTPRTTYSTLGDVELFVPEEREFTVSDGTVVQGWLLRDPARAGRLPLLLDVHGGPHNAWGGLADPVHLYHQVLAARGWAVLMLNPRASDGYGAPFYTAAVGAWGEADARDFLEPLDQLVAEGVAEPQRLAVTGYSYGGYMTSYLTSHDDRFAAAVAGGIMSDLISMAGTSDLHRLGAKELGGITPWNDRERFTALSPFTEVGRVRTPTLIMHGSKDERCPAGQAEQWFSALRERGVPSRLVFYPGGSHNFILERPSHRADWNQRVVDWVEQYAGEPGRPQRVPVDAPHWHQRLAELATRHRVPGAALGILRLGYDADEAAFAHHGVLNNATGVEVTDDSVFQIGSITTVWAATVVMQLVDEGKLDLDAPIVGVLPELRLSDPEVTTQVTMRHLLTHTSGIDGDAFTDTGRGDDCLERYVDQLHQVGQNHPLGGTFSYCNSGFILAGRVIEKLTGQTWETALRERLFTPLGLSHTMTLPEEALRFRAAIGHTSQEDAEPQPLPMWGLPRAAGPAALITASTADVLAFARMHLTGGAAWDGTRVLSAASTEQMAQEQIELPDKETLSVSWGLGWRRLEWDGHPLIGHDGNTSGQQAFLRILPSDGIAVVLLTNGGDAQNLYDDMYREIFWELTGVAMPQPLTPPVEPPIVDASRHLGLYERAGARVEILDVDGTLRLRQTATGPLAELLRRPTQEFDLIPISDTRFALRQPGTQTWTPVTFYTLPSGEPYLHYDGGRSTPKTS